MATRKIANLRQCGFESRRHVHTMKIKVLSTGVTSHSGFTYPLEVVQDAIKKLGDRPVAVVHGRRSGRPLILGDAVRLVSEPPEIIDGDLYCDIDKEFAHWLDEMDYRLVMSSIRSVDEEIKTVTECDFHCIVITAN